MATRKDLVQALRDRAGLTVREAALCVDALVEWVEETLVSGEDIELRGLVGAFSVKQTAARKMSFTNTAKDIVPAHGRITFRPYKKLKLAVWKRKL